MMSICPDEPATADDDPPAPKPLDPQIEDRAEAERTEQRRMWCLQQAMSVSLTCLARAPTTPLIPIVLTAEEMCEFIETGVARTHRGPRTEQ